MKLFHTENGKEVVYVQMQDIMYLVNDTDISVPDVITEKVITDVRVVDASNRFDFVKFEDEYVVKFFKELEFVIDYEEYANLSGKQLGNEIKLIANSRHKLTQKWADMTEVEREENSEIFDTYCNIRYMLKYLYEVCAVKCKNIIMPFPEFVEQM